jgi:hypothetical protein
MDLIYKIRIVLAIGGPLVYVAVLCLGLANVMCWVKIGWRTKALMFFSAEVVFLSFLLGFSHFAYKMTIVGADNLMERARLIYVLNAYNSACFLVGMLGIVLTKKR